MAMATQSLTATIAATRSGTRILMREGDDCGARSLQRRRRRGGMATAQRNATHGRRRGARDTAHARRGAQTLERGRPYFSVERDQKRIVKRGVMGGIGDRRRREAVPLVLVRRALARYHVPGDATPAPEAWNFSSRLVA